MNEEKNTNIFLALKQNREALGLTLRDIFQRTRITIVNLEAIENGDLHLLPVPIYTKNFIKTFARALGIDSKPFLESYEDYLNSLQTAQNLSAENLSEDITFLAKIGQYKAYLWTAAALIFIVIVSLFVSSQNQPATDINNNLAGKIEVIDPGKKADTLSPPTKATVPVNEQAKAIPQPDSSETNKIKQIPAQSNAIRQESAATPPRGSIAQNTRAVAESGEISLLTIKATEETWIRIQADQNPSYQITLQPGEKFERKAASFDLVIGNAGGITMRFKGKNIENIGKYGEVIHLRLP
jgi:cytoskeleton protein RodZ